jgi:hypothetical protein
MEFARSLAPWGIHGQKLPTEEARLRYLARLDARVDEVVAELAAIAARHPECERARSHPGQALALLCFEEPGQVCHRRWIAEFMEVRFDIDIPELADPQLRLPL